MSFSGIQFGTFTAYVVRIILVEMLANMILAWIFIGEISLFLRLQRTDNGYCLVTVYCSASVIPYSLSKITGHYFSRQSDTRVDC